MQNFKNLSTWLQLYKQFPSKAQAKPVIWRNSSSKKLNQLLRHGSLLKYKNLQFVRVHQMNQLYDIFWQIFPTSTPQKSQNLCQQLGTLNLWYAQAQ